jgi:hypothetical protein
MALIKAYLFAVVRDIVAVLVGISPVVPSAAVDVAVPRIGGVHMVVARSALKDVVTYATVDDVGTPVPVNLVGLRTAPNVVAASLAPDGVGAVVAAYLVCPSGPFSTSSLFVPLMSLASAGTASTATITATTTDTPRTRIEYVLNYFTLLLYPE